jgi:septal ring factor EnvC (AmiA/AmiB activator)
LQPKFIKSNEDKRERAVQRQIEDRRLVEEKSQQIENLQEEIAALQKVKAEFDAEIQKLKNYEVSS